MRDKIYVSCDLCGSGEFKYLYRINRHNENYDIVRCKKCGLVYMNPRFSSERIKQFYTKDYYIGAQEFHYADERKEFKATEYLNQARLTQIKKHKKGYNLLEIGCSFGYFLKTARDMGWNVSGVELSEYSSKYAKEKLNLKVYTGTIEQASFSDQLFDVVVMQEVIEHLESPTKTLNNIYRVSKPNGLLVIQTSNIESIYSRLTKDKWIYFLPGHLYYFSPKTLANLSKKTGFKIIKSYCGTDIGFKVVMKSYFAMTNKDVSIFKIILRHFLRKMHLMGLHVGAGMVYYLRRQ